MTQPGSSFFSQLPAPQDPPHASPAVSDKQNVGLARANLRVGPDLAMPGLLTARPARPAVTLDPPAEDRSETGIGQLLDIEVAPVADDLKPMRPAGAAASGSNSRPGVSEGSLQGRIAWRF